MRILFPRLSEYIFSGFAAPVNPTVVAVDGDRCTVEWQPPISHSSVPITGYIVRCLSIIILFKYHLEFAIIQLEIQNQILETKKLLISIII